MKRRTLTWPPGSEGNCWLNIKAPWLPSRNAQATISLASSSSPSLPQIIAYFSVTKFEFLHLFIQLSNILPASGSKRSRPLAWREETVMTKNVGGVEQGIRLVIGIALLALAVLHIVTGTMAIAAYIVGVVALITSLIRYCPAWTVFGINTCQTAHK